MLLILSQLDTSSQPYHAKLINLHVPLSNSIYKDYEYYSFSEMHGYFNCLQAISL